MPFLVGENLMGGLSPPGGGESDRRRLLRTENLLSLSPGLDVLLAMTSSPLYFFLSVIRTFFFRTDGVTASFGSFRPRLIPGRRTCWKVVDNLRAYLVSGFWT